MATYEEYMDAARRADAAGEEGDAKRLIQLAEGAKPAVNGVFPAIDSMINFLGGNKGQRINDVARAAAQGATFGLADEAEAGLRSLGDETYEGALSDVRGSNKQFRKEHPITSTVFEGAGGVGTGFGVAGMGAKMFPRLAAKIPTLAKVTGGGAATGGLYGAGGAEGGLGPRLQAAKKGAKTGAVVAPLMYGGGRALAAGGRFLKNAVKGPGAPKSSALDLLAGDVAADQITPQRMASRLKTLGPRGTITDAGGPNVRTTARAVAGAPGPGQNTMRRALKARTQGETARIGEGINKNLSPADYFDSQDAFLKRLSDRARPLYKKAYGPADAPRVLKSEKLNELLSRRPIKRAVTEARQLAEIEGKTLDIPDEFTGGVKTEHIDDIKRGIDAMLESKVARNELTGKLTKRGMALAGLKRAILNEADRLNPAYKTARATYSGDAEVVGALKDGADFMKLAPKQIKKKLASLGSDAARDAYRSGAARAYKDIIEKTPDNQGAARKMFDSNMLRQKMRAVMPNDKAYHDMSRILIAEKRFKDVENTLMSGSQTAPRLKGDESLIQRAGNIGAIAGSASPAGHQLILAGIGRRIASAQASKLFTKRTAELAKILVEADPAKNATVINELIQRLGPAKERAAADVSKAIARMAAQQLGLHQ